MVVVFIPVLVPVKPLVALFDSRRIPPAALQHVEPFRRGGAQDGRKPVTGLAYERRRIRQDGLAPGPKPHLVTLHDDQEG
jgi:hypothetical protein